MTSSLRGVRTSVTSAENASPAPADPTGTPFTDTAAGPGTDSQTTQTRSPGEWLRGRPNRRTWRVRPSSAVVSHGGPRRMRCAVTRLPWPVPALPGPVADRVEHPHHVPQQGEVHRLPQRLEVHLQLARPRRPGERA